MVLTRKQSREESDATSREEQGPPPTEPNQGGSESTDRPPIQARSPQVRDLIERSIERRGAPDSPSPPMDTPVRRTQLQKKLEQINELIEEATGAFSTPTGGPPAQRTQRDRTPPALRTTNEPNSNRASPIFSIDTTTPPRPATPTPLMNPEPYRTGAIPKREQAGARTSYEPPRDYKREIVKERETARERELSRERREREMARERELARERRERERSRERELNRDDGYRNPRTTDVRFELPPRRPPSVTSRVSSTVETRKKEAELQAAEQLAELQRQQLRLEEDLIKKRLSVAVQRIEAEGSQAGDSQLEREAATVTVTQDPKQRVSEWLLQAEVSEADIPTPRRRRTVSPGQNEREPRDSRDRSSNQSRAIDRLADHLESMARPPPKQVYELPVYSGHPSEWLAFYHSYAESTKRYKFSNFENMSRLRAALRGEARECVLHILSSSLNPDLVMRVLKKNFGRTDLLIDRALEELRRLPTLGPSVTDLNTFAIKVTNIVSTLVDLDRRNYASNPLLIREITERLSPHLRSRWCAYAKDNLKNAESEIILLSEFLMEESDSEIQFSHARQPSRRTPATQQIQPTQPTRRFTNQNPNLNSSAVRRPQPSRAHTYVTERIDPCLCCGQNHRTTECRKLLGMSVGARWDWARDNRICFKCLDKRHRRESCTARGCSIPSCPHTHNRLLHDTAQTMPTQPELRPPAEPQSTISARPPRSAPRTPPRHPTAAPAQSRESEHVNTTDEITTSTVDRDSKVMLKIMPIVLSGPRGDVSTFAMVDDGSTVSLIDREIANELGVEGPETPLVIKGVGAICLSQPSQRVQVSARAKNGGPLHTLTLRTVANLGLREQYMPREAILKHEHLADLEDACYNGAVPRVLIGADHWHLTLPIEARTGAQNAPIAVRSKLGWVIYGLAPRYIQNREVVMHVYTDEEQSLNEELRRHFEVESLGIKLVEKTNPQDQRAIEIFEKTVRRLESEGRYEVGQLWREDNPIMPPSYAMAYNRLRGIERKMDRDPIFAAEYAAQINNLLAKDYAERHVGSCESNKTWILPHFAVRNANKGNKVRLVYDSRSVSQKTSLNSMLLEGPDLLQSLPGILFRFREGKYAVSADIQEMFLQIRMRPEDQMSQLFLWRGTEREQPPHLYKMKSLIFGNTSSPFIAHSVRNRNALDNAELYPEAVYDITTNHYMDDMIASYNSEQQAITIATQVAASHARGGFNLRSWASNSSKLMQQIPPEKRADEPTSLGSKGQKVLGLYWDPKTDELSFNTTLIRVPTDVKELKRGPTKREALSCLMSLFDPLGLLSHYTVTGKIILQELWTLKVSWDAQLPSDVQRTFMTWLLNLQHVSNLRLPRQCLLTEGEVSRQLHVMVDASEQAYAAIAYWRSERRDAGDVTICIAAAKSKVTPVRKISIPRAELQAALIGARLAQLLRNEHRIKPDQVVFWTDSRTVLHWVRENSRRYSAFVSHRLGEISELTEIKQWRWIPSKLNVADDATRADPERIVSSNDRWYRGPDFLYKPESEWPVESKSTNPEPPTETTEQLSNTERCHATRHVDPPLPQIERFSNYDRLIGATARALLFIERLKNKTKVPLDARHMHAAEHLWMQWAQRRDFPDELRALSRGEAIARDSKLYPLDPELAENGLIHMRGRINAAPASCNKNPVILDGRNPFVKLIILRAHKRAHHCSNETVVNDLRQLYWILHLRPSVRSVARACMMCVLRRTRPRMPPLGDLPPARLTPPPRAFTYSAVDLFGPLTVAVGRRREKRWICLFTCLSSRAVHMEMAYSLSTSSAVMALRRLAAKRGWPLMMFSDNGTNLRGCDAELRAAYAEWMPAMKEHGLLYKMTWRFIAPGAPHMGGAWERLIRTVKTSLAAVLNTRTPKEEILITLLAEVEYSVNSRPLTHVSVDPNEPEAITPNHFLLGGPGNVPFTGPCEESDRRTWRVSQALADHWWQRWLKEYLPTLAPRRSSTSHEPTVSVGDYVLIVDPTMPRNVWPRGIVEATYRGPDGAVRNVDVRTRGGVFRRPTSRLAVLPITTRSPPSSDRGETVTDSEHADRLDDTKT